MKIFRRSLNQICIFLWDSRSNRNLEAHIYCIQYPYPGSLKWLDREQKKHNNNDQDLVMRTWVLQKCLARGVCPKAPNSFSSPDFHVHPVTLSNSRRIRNGFRLSERFWCCRALGRDKSNPRYFFETRKVKIKILWDVRQNSEKMLTFAVSLLIFQDFATHWNKRCQNSTRILNFVVLWMLQCKKAIQFRKTNFVQWYSCKSSLFLYSSLTIWSLWQSNLAIMCVTSEISE